MKKVILIVVIVLAVFIGTILFIQKSAPPVPVIPTPSTQPTGTPIVTYFCKEGSITATYSPTGVSLSISDGRKMDLPQVMSGSGTRYEQGAEAFLSKGSSAYMQESGMTTYNDCVAGTETVFKDMYTFTDSTKQFTFVFPTAFNLSGGEMGFTQSWRQDSTDQGLLLAKITVPKSFQPGTNFSEAAFTVGTSADPKAVASCLQNTSGGTQVPTTVTINRYPFTKIVSGDAGAGNIYQSTSYRTVRNDQCYAIEYTIHSTNIGNYDPSQHVTEFDQAKVDASLDAIMQSFKFSN